MNKLTPSLIAAVCSVCLLATGCPAGNNGSDAGNNNNPTDAGNNNNPVDAGNNNSTDAGNNPTDAGNNPTDAGPQDAGVNCDGGGCYLCAPTNYSELVNHCTTAQGITKNPTGLPLLPDGGLPPLP
jgi:hypothetical protein